MKKPNVFLFVSLLFLSFLNYCTFGIPAIFFPKVASDRGLPESMIGIIFSMYPLFSFIFGFLMSKNLKKWEKKWILQIGIFFLGGSTLLFGLSCILPYMSLFVTFSIVGRCSQGVSIAVFLTAAYAYIPEYWPEETDKRIGWMELSATVGIMAGPLMGSVLFEVGYIWMYIIPSILIIFIGNIVCFFVFPASAVEKSEKSIEFEKAETQANISIRESFCNREMLYVFFSLVMPFTSCNFIIPGFELKVLQMANSHIIATVIYVIGQMGYVIGCVIWLFFKVENRRGLFYVSAFFNILGLLMFGIDKIFEVSEVTYLTLMGLGYFLLQLMVSLTTIPNISENIAVLKKIFMQTPEKVLINMASGIYTAAVSLAEFQGPLFGGIFFDYFGFSLGCLMFSGANLIFFILLTLHQKWYRNFADLVLGKKIRDVSKTNNIETMKTENELLPSMPSGQIKEYENETCPTLVNIFSS